jgi:hypothetical protein
MEQDSDAFSDTENTSQAEMSTKENTPLFLFSFLFKSQKSKGTLESITLKRLCGTALGCMLPEGSFG